MKKLLVTGAAGFIGSNFVHYWHENYPEDLIVVLDALTYAGNRDNIADLEKEENFKFVHGDIGDTALVEKLLTETGFELQTIEDRTADLKESLGQIIFDHGSLEAWFQKSGGWRCKCTPGKGTGYFLMISRRKADL